MGLPIEFFLCKKHRMYYWIRNLYTNIKDIHSENWHRCSERVDCNECDFLCDMGLPLQIGIHRMCKKCNLKFYCASVVLK